MSKRGYPTKEVLEQFTKDYPDPDDMVLVEKEDPQAKDVDPEPQPQPGPQPEPKAESEQPEITKEKDEAPNLADKIDLLQNQIDFFRSASQSQQPQPQQQREPGWGEITDVDQYLDKLNRLENTAMSAFRAVGALEMSNAQRALAELKQQYPDIDQYIKTEDIQQGIQIRMQSGSYGADWMGPMLQVYDIATSGKRHRGQGDEMQKLRAELDQIKAELAQRNDELAQKRAQRIELKQAGFVPPGGGAFQQADIPEVPTMQRGYKHAARAFEKALNNLGG